MNIIYEAITAACLKDYEQVILPVVYHELEPDKEPVENGYLCIGARIRGEPAAAIVVYLEPYGDLDLRSLFVCTKFRRLGLASALTERAVQVAAASFLFEEPEDEISFKTMYALPWSLKKPWEAFLRADGFFVSDAVGTTYELDSRDLAQSKAFSPAFAKDFVPCEDEGIAVVILEEAPGRFLLDQMEALEDVSGRRLLRAIQAAIAALAKDGQPFTLIIPDHIADESQMWRQAVGTYGKCYEQCVAWQDIALKKQQGTI